MTARIADISQHQDIVDWNTARNELDFIIFRASIGLKPDTLYLSHTAGWGKPFAAFHYVKAGKAGEAREDLLR